MWTTCPYPYRDHSAHTNLVHCCKLTFDESEGEESVGSPVAGVGEVDGDVTGGVGRERVDEEREKTLLQRAETPPATSTHSVTLWIAVCVCVCVCVCVHTIQLTNSRWLHRLCLEQ